MNEIRIKRGAALIMQMAFTDDFSVPIDLTNVTLAAQVRDSSDNLVAVLPITITAQTGIATVQVADTTLWPVGLLRTDILLTTAGLPVLSESIPIRVNRQITQ